MHDWLVTYDRNLPLLDVISDPEASDQAARLAALALGESPDGGYYDAEALADAVTELWAESVYGIHEDGSEARAALTDLLERGGGYTRDLFDTVKTLPPGTAAKLLSAHAKLMMERADMVRLAREVMGQAA